MQLPTFLSFLALGVSSVSAIIPSVDPCTPVRDPYPRTANTGFDFDDKNTPWKWVSHNTQVVTTLYPAQPDDNTSTLKETCRLHQGGGGGSFAQLVCIDFSGNYACWATPAENEVCDIAFEQAGTVMDVCGSINNMWGWAA